MDILLHIPHSSTHIPFLDGYIINQQELKSEIDLLTDWYTDDLFDCGFKKLVAPCSRIFCDVERFPNDSDEVMSKFGMGMCYTHLDNGKLMRNVNTILKDRIKSNYYDQHHKIMTDLVQSSLDHQNNVLIVDCHSFPDMPLNRDLKKDIPRPDFCIGVDEYHTHEKALEYCYSFLTKKGFSVKLNDPYSGTYVPLQYLHSEKKVNSIMIEINRKLYLNSETTVSKNNEYPIIKKLMCELINSLAFI